MQAVFPFAGQHGDTIADFADTVAFRTIRTYGVETTTARTLCLNAYYYVAEISC